MPHKKIVALTLLSSLVLPNSAAVAGPGDTIERYPSPLASIELMKRVAPFRNTELENECFEITVQSASMLVAVDPLQGRALDSQPGPFYYPYLDACIGKAVEIGFAEEKTAAQNAELILGSELAARIRQLARTSSAKEAWSSIDIRQLPPELRTAVVARMVYFLVGPEIVLRRLGYFGEKSSYKTKPQTLEALYAFLFDLLTTGDDLTPADNTLLGFYPRLAANLRLGPPLRTKVKRGN